MNTSKLGANAGDRVRDARAEEGREDQPAPSEAVGQQADDERDEHAGPGDREREPEVLVGLVERVRHRVGVLGEQRTAEAREHGHGGEGGEAGRLARR